MTYPGEEGVTLCVTRAQEVGGYSHYDDCFDALEIMKTLCGRMPVHTVFGEIIDLVYVASCFESGVPHAESPGESTQACDNAGGERGRERGAADEVYSPRRRGGTHGRTRGPARDCIGDLGYPA